MLQDSSLRLCHRRVFQSENQNRSLSQTNPKVIMFSFENVWEVNKKLLSKRFSLAGKGGRGAERARFTRALRCHRGRGR